MRAILVPSLLVLTLGAGLALSADKAEPRPAGELPAIRELPDPFTFQDGSHVSNSKDWPRRREELKKLFQQYEYGHLPPRPQKKTIQRGETAMDDENKVAMQDLEVTWEHEGKTLLMHVRLAWPSESKKPVPVVMRSSFGRLGRRSGRSFAAFTKRGYGVAEFSLPEVAADNKDRARTSGVYRLFGDKIDCGGLMAWAWGFHRLVDVLETSDKFDAKRIVVTGHSRYGKAALVAGAFDERIALTVPSHSGCGGAAPYRFIYGRNEQLHNIVGAFPYWFRPDFKQFVDKVEHLPIDQHLLLALVAPRAVLQSEGTRDDWTNPEGAQQTFAGAKKVYDFLKAGDNINIRFRPVGHIPSNEDLMDYADHVFFKKPLPEGFGSLPYKEDKKALTWDAPK